MRRFIGSLAVSSLVGAVFISALALAHAQAPAPAATVQEAFGKEKAADAIPPAVKAAVAKPDVRKLVRRPPQQPNRAPMVQQLINQARPLLRAELIFARKACQLNREELRRVNGDASKMLEEVVTKIVDAQFQPRAQAVPVAGPIQKNAARNVDAHQLLQDGVASVMKKDLTAAQWSIYEAERAKRDENRKQMTIRYMVDAIDRELYLSPDQRDQLEGSLKSNWDSNWTLYLENHLYGNRFYPMTIDGLVTPILTEAQKKVWQGVQKVGVYWGFSGMLGGFANDADGLEVELGEPLKAAPAQNRMRRMLKIEQAVADPQAVQPAAVMKEARPADQKKKPSAPAQPAPAKTKKKVETTND